MIGIAASMVTQCGFSGLFPIIPFIIQKMMVNSGILDHTNKLLSSLPSLQKTQSTVICHFVDTVLLVIERITKNPNVYMLRDKGYNMGNKNIAKLYCRYKEGAFIFLLGVDCTNEDIEDIFEGLAHSIKRLFGVTGRCDNFQLKGQCTNSRG